MTLARLTRRLGAAARAARGFLAGFTGMPSARLDARCAHSAAAARRATRDALAERAARRPRCC